jgi:predicted nucleotidyltransferase
MNRADVLQLLKQCKPHLVREFGITELALFGSVARDEAQTASDADILVKFDGQADSRRFFGVQFYLEDLLGCPVDLVTDKALREELRSYVQKDAIHV